MVSCPQRQVTSHYWERDGERDMDGGRESADSERIRLREGADEREGRAAAGFRAPPVDPRAYPPRADAPAYGMPSRPLWPDGEDENPPWDRPSGQIPVARPDR